MIGRNLIFLAILINFHVVYSGCPFQRKENLPKSSRETRSVKVVADPETSTPNGCTCNSLCGATIEDGFTNDWCTVEGSCGEYTLLIGYWDWCLYKDSSKPDYVAQDWETKYDQLWSEIKSDASYGGYHPTDAFSESLITSFENEWDVMPAGRRKAIHSVGAVCPFTVDISPDSPYTGLFKAGEKSTGFIRMGGATDFTDTPGMTPGVGIKFLRSGTSSANFVLLKELNPLPDNSHNFFAATLTNHLPANIEGAITIALALRFCTTGHCITKVGLSNVCTHDQEGTEYPDPIFPFKVSFEPNPEVSFPDAAPGSMTEFLDQFKAIPVGTKLYTIKAMENPENPMDSILGNLVTADECVSSNFGDTEMFFKHQWIEEDIALRPEWTDNYSEGCYCNFP